MIGITRRWPEAKLPTKEMIDRYTPETPVFVNRLDGHMALANSVALETRRGDQRPRKILMAALSSAIQRLASQPAF